MVLKRATKNDKPLTKAKTIETLAEETGLSKKEITNVLETLADLAHKQAVAGFTIPLATITSRITSMPSGISTSPLTIAVRRCFQVSSSAGSKKD